MRELFTTLIDAHRAVPELDVLAAELGPAASPPELERLERWFGGRVPDDIRAFYSAVGSVQIRWVATANPKNPHRELRRGLQPWDYALKEKVDDGALVLPPIDVVLARSWAQEFDGMWIWVDGTAHAGPKLEPDGFDRELRIFDFSSWDRQPGFFRSTGLVGIGGEMGWQGKRMTFGAYLERAVRHMRGLADDVRSGNYDFH